MRHTHAWGRADTQPVTDNGIAREQSADTQNITKTFSLTILHVNQLISNDIFNTNTHRQWR